MHHRGRSTQYPGVAALILLAALSPHHAAAQRLAGKWQGTIHYDSLTIPFPLLWSGSGKTLALSFFNGETRITSTSVERHGDSLSVQFAQLATELSGVLNGTRFVGSYGPPQRRNPAVVATIAERDEAADRDPPNIGGVWYLPTKSSKGEDAWRLVVTQHGGDATATILRIDGDAGALTGSWRNGVFTLYHFDGTRPARLIVRPEGDSSLSVVMTTGPRGNSTRYTAIRPHVAQARGLPGPADFATFTTVRDLSEPFHFAFPDLNGREVRNTDPQFRNKVVLVTIGGSWCPNCHDEAPFLAALFRKYRNRGLAVVSLDFEEKNALEDLSRLRAFVTKYGIDYPVLIAGETGRVHELLPQAVNLNTWPATFFLGRDGTVRAVRAGFAAPASGEFHKRLEQDYTAIIEGLLREPPSAHAPQ